MDNHNITTSLPNLKGNIINRVTINKTLPINIDNSKKNEIQCLKIQNSNSKIKQKKKNRCAICKKKLGVLGFECKCKLMFCSEHLTPETHNCAFDYKNEQCKKLEKTLVKVVADKVIRI